MRKKKQHARITDAAESSSNRERVQEDETELARRRLRMKQISSELVPLEVQEMLLARDKIKNLKLLNDKLRMQLTDGHRHVERLLQEFLSFSDEDVRSDIEQQVFGTVLLSAYFEAAESLIDMAAA